MVRPRPAAKRLPATNPKANEVAACLLLCFAPRDRREWTTCTPLGGCIGSEGTRRTEACRRVVVGRRGRAGAAVTWF